MSVLDGPPAPHSITPEHVQFRATMPDRVARETAPCVNDWDQAGSLPRELCRSAAAIGAIGIGLMRGTKGESGCRQVKVMMIGGGSEGVMKDLAARQPGI